MVTDPERAEAYRRGRPLGRRRRCPAAWPRWRPSGPTGWPSSTATASAVHSYAELGRDVSTFAAWLEARGVGAGDVVSIQLPNWYEFVVVAVATQRVGAVINPLLPDLPPQGAAPRLHRRRVQGGVHAGALSRPTTIWPPRARSSRSRGAPSSTWSSTTERPRDGDGGRRRPPSGSATSSPARRGRRGQRDAGGPGARLAAPQPGAVSELIFTSGTEAAPKAIMHTEQTANFSVRVAAAGPGDRRRRRRVDAVADRALDRFQLRRALCPLSRVAAGAAGPLGRRRWPATSSPHDGASYTLASTTFLQDLVAEAERRGGRGRSGP